jgi:hypothetical protein
MLLAREFVDYISRQIIRKLTPQWIETTDVNVAAGFIAEVIEEDLAVEDRLNDEVRELLSQYSDYMRREGVSYQDMFRRIKNTLIQQRKVIRASGRDSGDPMKLSRDKINDISHKVVAALRKSREFRLKRDPNDVRLELVKVMTEMLQTEEKVDRAARTKIRTQKREISEGTEEWAVPFTAFIAASTVKQFKSGILILAISSTCLSVILPTRFLLGSAEPLARPQARLIRTGTGGVLVMKVKERSE